MNINRPCFFPVVGLKVTNRCRMQCKFCCEQRRDYSQYDLEQYEKLIDLLHKSEVKRICYTGGEPLLCPFLEQALKKAHELGIDNILLTTDGEKLKELTVPKEYVDTIRISLHAIGEKHDEIVQKKGAFKDLEDGIKRLTKLGYNVSVNTVLTPEAFPDAEEIVKWCINNNIKKIYFANLLQSGKGEEFIKKSGRISDSDFEKLILNLKEKYETDDIKIISHPYKKNAECILMYGNGDIYIDPYFDDNETHQKFIGNILKDSPKDVFDNFSKSGKAWDDYLERLSRSTIYDKK